MQSAIDLTIEGGYCIGCGACAAMAPEDFSLDFTEFGMFQARALGLAETRRGIDPDDFCPMSGSAPDETEIAAQLYPTLPAHPEIGRHAMTGVGWVAEGDMRARGSSGGFLTWIAREMLARGMVDEVVQVGSDPPGAETLFSYRVSRTPGEVVAAAKSRYYPVQVRDAIVHMRASGRRTLFIGIPCFVKAIRNLAAVDPALGEAVAFTLGLICGHLKSAAFAEMLAWQVGVPPGQIGRADFRVKVEGQPASRYGFAADSLPPESRHGEALMADLFGRNWGHGVLKYKACDYCDDVLAECADIAIGDAWLAHWNEDWRGTNVFVARHPEIVALLKEGVERGQLHVETIAHDQAAKSQRGGLSHRREGLAWRLWKAREAGVWTPRKRVAASNEVPPWRRHIYDLRASIREESHGAFRGAKLVSDFEVFRARLAPLLAAHDRIVRPTPSVRKRIVRVLRRLRISQPPNKRS